MKSIPNTDANIEEANSPSDRELRRKVAQSLAIVSTPAEEQIVLSLLDDSDPIVLRGAVTAASRLPVGSALLSKLESLCHHPDPLVTQVLSLTLERLFSSAPVSPTRGRFGTTLKWAIGLTVTSSILILCCAMSGSMKAIIPRSISVERPVPLAVSSKSATPIALGVASPSTTPPPAMLGYLRSAATFFDYAFSVVKFTTCGACGELVRTFANNLLAGEVSRNADGSVVRLLPAAQQDDGRRLPCVLVGDEIGTAQGLGGRLLFGGTSLTRLSREFGSDPIFLFIANEIEALKQNQKETASSLNEILGRLNRQDGQSVGPSTARPSTVRPPTPRPPTTRVTHSHKATARQAKLRRRSQLRSAQTVHPVPSGPARLPDPRVGAPIFLDEGNIPSDRDAWQGVGEITDEGLFDGNAASKSVRRDEKNLEKEAGATLTDVPGTVGQPELRPEMPAVDEDSDGGGGKEPADEQSAGAVKPSTLRDSTAVSASPVSAPAITNTLSAAGLRTKRLSPTARKLLQQLRERVQR